MSTPVRRGPGRPRKRPAGEQRAAILLAARHAFAEHGEHGTTVERVARDAAVTRQAVYEQFTDRAGLFRAVVADVEERVVEWVGAQARDNSEPNLRRWIRANYASLFEFVANHPDAMPVLTKAERAGDPALTRVRGRLAELYTEASRQRWAEYGIEPGRADTALVTMYITMTESLVNLPWDDDPPERDALVDLLTEFTVGGLQRLHEQAAEVMRRLR